MHHCSLYVLVGIEALVLQPSCSLAALPMAALEPLTVLRSLQLPCAFLWLLPS